MTKTIISSLQKKLSICFIVALLFSSSTIFGQNNDKLRLIEGWQYVKGEIGSPWEAWRSEKLSRLPIWTTVKLPHCFNAYDAVDPDIPYYEGPGWYKTTLKTNNPYKNGRILLHFEGAGQKTDIYLYTQKVGSHVGGYDEFTIDITDAVKKFNTNKELTELFKGEIPIAIRCDNTRNTEMIPSDLSDFNVYGGLYRYVNLVYAPTVSTERIYINSETDLNTKKTTINISAKLNNPTNYKGKTELTVQIKSPKGKIIKSYNQSITSWNQFKDILSFEIENPELWSPDAPNLYDCVFTIKTPNGKHTINEKFGVRHFEFIKKGPFKLNGQRLLLRGTHRHEDHAGTAAAMTEDMIIQEMEMMKEMGVNFIRLGHYQQSRIVLEQCDKLGILVWEEIPWCRGGLGGEQYKEQARRMLTNMIDQHRNHPSIIIWGLGNENDWPGDFPEFDKEKIRTFMKELHALSHKLDITRKTAIRRCDFCKDIVDVYSPSIWAGWYRGKFTQYKEVSKMEMETVNHFLHVEWGASNHARRHSETPDQGLANISTKGNADEQSGDFLLSGGDARASKDGDWSETYACNLTDWHLKEQETMPWLTGTAYWPFKDFSTPLRPDNPVPFVNQKGVVERDFTKKELFYVFQSYWIKKPMAHIYGHTWTTRWGKKNENKIVKVYSNCSEAELFLNGEALGKKIRNSQNFPAAGLRWIVKFKMGENKLKVIAKKDGKEVIDSSIVNYQIGEWDKPNRFIFETVSQKNDTALMRVITIDEKGLLCLDAKNFVRFKLSGDGKLIDNLGTSTGSNKVQLYNGRALIKVKMNGGNSVVSVSADGIPTEFAKINTSNPDNLKSENDAKQIKIKPTTPKEIKGLMTKVCNWQLANMPEVDGRHYQHYDWTNAVLYSGIMEAYKITKDKNYLNTMLKFSQENEWKPGKRFRHADDHCIGQTYAELYFIKKDEKMIAPICETFDKLMADSKPGHIDWWWCDALYMAPPALARLYTATGEKKYLDYMNSMWWDTHDFLYDKDEHLFFRDDRFRIKADGSGQREPNGKKVFWSRGNGWVMGGIARVLEHLPKDYVDRDKYISLFTEMAEKIITLQGNDGLWKSSLLYHDPYPHGEVSGSGFYCYALAWGINNGILSKEKYLPAVQKSWTAMTNAVQSSGKLGWIQKIGFAPETITADETEVYGIGAFLLAGSEIIKLY